MTMYPLCVDCRYFSPEGRLHNDLAESEVANPDMLEGECRRCPPVVGEQLTDRHGDTFRHYGEWPRAMGCDWCGAFEPCQRVKGRDVSPQLARVAAGAAGGTALPPSPLGHTGQRGPSSELPTICPRGSG
jgi:hypothetical protein